MANARLFTFTKKRQKRENHNHVVISDTLNNCNRRKQHNEPIRTQSVKCGNAWEQVTIGFGFTFWFHLLVEKMGRAFLTSRRSVVLRDQSERKLIATLDENQEKNGGNVTPSFSCSFRL